jgi:hypothetical protein
MLIKDGAFASAQAALPHHVLDGLAAAISGAAHTDLSGCRACRGERPHTNEAACGKSKKDASSFPADAPDAFEFPDAPVSQAPRAVPSSASRAARCRAGLKARAGASPDDSSLAAPALAVGATVPAAAPILAVAPKSAAVELASAAALSTAPAAVPSAASMLPVPVSEIAVDSDRLSTTAMQLAPQERWHAFLSLRTRSASRVLAPPSPSLPPASPAVPPPAAPVLPPASHKFGLGPGYARPDESSKRRVEQASPREAVFEDGFELGLPQFFPPHRTFSRNKGHVKDSPGGASPGACASPEPRPLVAPSRHAFRWDAYDFGSDDEDKEPALRPITRQPTAPVCDLGED